MKAYMYILKCSDDTYYTGSTVDLDYRIEQHKNGEGSNYTSDRLPVELIYTEEFRRIEDAFEREKQVQKWSHKKKEALMEGNIKQLRLLSRNYTEHKPDL